MYTNDLGIKLLLGSGAFIALLLAFAGAYIIYNAGKDGPEGLPPMSQKELVEEIVIGEPIAHYPSLFGAIFLLGGLAGAAFCLFMLIYP